MNKREFCRNMVRLVDNCRVIDGMTDEEIAEAMEGLIAPLEPKDKKRFAAWGTPDQQCSVENCW